MEFARPKGADIAILGLRPLRIFIRRELLSPPTLLEFASLVRQQRASQAFLMSAPSDSRRFCSQV